MNDIEVLRGGTSIKTSIEINFEEFCGDALGNDYGTMRIDKRLGRKFDIKMVKSNG